MPGDRLTPGPLDHRYELPGGVQVQDVVAGPGLVDVRAGGTVETQARRGAVWFIVVPSDAVGQAAWS